MSMLKKKSTSSVNNLVEEVNNTLGLFDKIVNNLKSAKEKIDMQVIEREEQIAQLQVEHGKLIELGNKAVSVSEKIQALLS